MVRILDASSVAVVGMLRLSEQGEAEISDREIQSVVAEAEEAGVIEPAERRMISGVMRLGDRPVRGLMTPRTDVAWIDVKASAEELRATFTSIRHSLLPVGDGSIDATLGVVSTREVLGALLAGGSCDLRGLVQQATVLTDGADALEALRILREAARPMAFVHDEYGHFEGLVTPSDILQAIVGAFLPEEAGARSGAVRHDDGSWDLAGWLPADETAEHFGLRLPCERDYDTVAGFVLTGFPQLPAAGERMTSGRWNFEVVKLGRRIDRLHATEARDTSDP